MGDEDKLNLDAIRNNLGVLATGKDEYGVEVRRVYDVLASSASELWNDGKIRQFLAELGKVDLIPYPVNGHGGGVDFLGLGFDFRNGDGVSKGISVVVCGDPVGDLREFRRKFDDTSGKAYVNYDDRIELLRRVTKSEVSRALEDYKFVS